MLLPVDAVQGVGVGKECEKIFDINRVINFLSVTGDPIFLLNLGLK
jgi:hypothetical protein